MHLANLAVYLGLRSKKKSRKQRRSRTVEKQRSKEAGKQKSKKMPKTGNKIIPPQNSSPFDAPLSHKASWRSPARWDLQSFMFPSGPHRCNRAQENAGSEPAEMDVDDEVAPLLPLPVEKEESHLWRATMGYRVPS
jgi:hypothetical protein